MGTPTELVVAGAKLTHYLLDLSHPDGGSKAKFFLARGFSRAQPQQFAEALSRHATSDDCMRTIAEYPDGRSERRMIVVGPLACPDGSTPLLKAIWQFDEGSDTASFVTAYPARRQSSSS